MEHESSNNNKKTFWGGPKTSGQEVKSSKTQEEGGRFCFKSAFWNFRQTWPTPSACHSVALCPIAFDNKKKGKKVDIHARRVFVHLIETSRVELWFLTILGVVWRKLNRRQGILHNARLSFSTQGNKKPPALLGQYLWNTVKSQTFKIKAYCQLGHKCDCTLLRLEGFAIFRETTHQQVRSFRLWRQCDQSGHRH